MKEIKYRKKASTFLKGIPQEQRNEIYEKAESLRITPFPNDSKKLGGFSFHKIDVGEFCIIYELNGDTVEIARIGLKSEPSNEDDYCRAAKKLISIGISQGLITL